MARIYIVIIIILFDLSTIYTQNKSNFTFKLSIGRITNARTYNYPYIDEKNPGGSWIEKKNIPHFRLESCFLINNNIDLGIYTGISNLKVPINIFDIYNNGSITTYGYFLGTEMNLHILPFFVKKPIRLDIYGTTNIGMILKSWYGYTNLPINTDNEFEIGVGIGLSYLISHKFGIFSELLYGKLSNNNLTQKVGLNFRL